MDKYIGRLLDNRYEILEAIGSGGMAVVYKARCHRLNRLVAIKILKDDYLEDEEFRRRFHSEGQAVAMLSHPNIVSVYDVSTSITADYIVMELIDGITLKQYMEKKGVLNWKETLHFAIQIAKALEHAHGRGIVHRDIKPHNVMVLKNGSVKVTDFGIARMMSQGNTLTKEALGSVHYISPEQAKGGRVDNRSDIYSLGVVMYEMMSGRPPYDGESPVAVAIQHINGGAVMPSTLNPNIPGGLEQIIMKAMAHEPDGRYNTASDLLTDLDEFRKNPGILFDYNVPPTDAVINLPKAPVEEPEVIIPKTTAERMERRNAGERRTPGERRSSGERQKSPAAAAVAAQRRRPPQQRNASQRRREAEQNRTNVATISIIVCAVVMLIAIGILLIFGLGGNEAATIKIPKLVGLTEKNAKDKASDYFTVDVKQEFNDDVKIGEVIRQEPVAGHKAKEGTKITIYVSKGRSEAEMFNVTSMTKEEVMQQLLDLNIKITFKEELVFDEVVEEGKVVATNYSEGVIFKSGAEITLFISQGKEILPGTMPDLTGKPLEQATKILKDQNLELDIQPKEEFNSDVEEGCVIRTDPVSGTELKTGDTIIIYFSKGPDLRELPDVMGMNVVNADKKLKDKDFTNVTAEEVESDKKALTVVEILADGQPVKAGDKIDVNAEIVIRYAKDTTTKNVKLDISKITAPEEGPYDIVVTTGDQKVYEKTFDEMPKELDLGSQTGSGKVKYYVSINGDDGVLIEENFDA